MFRPPFGYVTNVIFVINKIHVFIRVISSLPYDFFFPCLGRILLVEAKFLDLRNCTVSSVQPPSTVGFYSFLIFLPIIG